MTLPHGIDDVDTTQGIYLVSAHASGDTSIADLAGQDEDAVRARYKTKYISGDTSSVWNSANTGGLLGQASALLPFGMAPFAVLGQVWTALNQIGDIVDGLVVTPINTAVQAFYDWWNGIFGGDYSAGAGLTLSGSTFNVGAGTGITVNADDVAINTSVVVRKFAANVGDGSSTSIAVTHNLGTRDVTVSVHDASTFQEETNVTVVKTDANNVTLTFVSAPAANAYRCVVHG